MAGYVPGNELQRGNILLRLHGIVTGDEKWIFFENPKRQRSWVDPGTASSSTVRPNRFGKKTMLCVWWDQKGIVYYELLKPGETVSTVSTLPTTNDRFEDCIGRQPTAIPTSARQDDLAPR